MNPDLKRLREVANEILADLSRQMRGRVLRDTLLNVEPINWGDLSCVKAERWEDDGGESGFRIWVEEVAPEAIHLREYLREKLKEKGLSGVEVVTEW